MPIHVCASFFQMQLRISIRGSVHWSVRLSVGPSVHRSIGHAFIKIAENRAFLHESLLQPISNVEKGLITHATQPNDASSLIFHTYIKLYIHFLLFSRVLRDSISHCVCLSVCLPVTLKLFRRFRRLLLLPNRTRLVLPSIRRRTCFLNDSS